MTAFLSSAVGAKEVLGHPRELRGSVCRARPDLPHLNSCASREPATCERFDDYSVNAQPRSYTVNT